MEKTVVIAGVTVSIGQRVRFVPRRVRCGPQESIIEGVFLGVQKCKAPPDCQHPEWIQDQDCAVVVGSDNEEHTLWVGIVQRVEFLESED